MRCEARPAHGFHSLRHFYASLLIESSFTPKRIQTLLGHSSIQMTFDTYGHLFKNPDDDLGRLAELEERLLRPAPESMRQDCDMDDTSH
jgi:integrase